MIARGFKQVGWVAAVGVAALGCYMVSLNVASERAELQRIELAILTARKEIKALETELGTRGRFSQLEHWNAEVLALSAPASHQILPNEVRLASLAAPAPGAADAAAGVRLAAAPAAPAAPKPVPASAPVPAAADPQPMLRRASLVAVDKPAAAPVKAAAPSARPPASETVKAAAQPRPPVRKAAAPAPGQAGLFDGGLAGEIEKAARAEAGQSGGGAAAR